MKDFENLQKDWKTIKASNIGVANTSDSLLEKLIKVNNKIIYSNIAASLAFIITVIILVWIWFRYTNNGTFLFQISILSMGILLLVSFVLLWHRALFWKTPEFNKNVHTFSKNMLKKLSFYKWVTNIYIPIYTLLLSINLILYFEDVLKNVNFWTTCIVYVVTFGWICIGSFIFIRRQQKKNKEEIDPIINELKRVRTSLESMNH